MIELMKQQSPVPAIRTVDVLEAFVKSARGRTRDGFERDGRSGNGRRRAMLLILMALMVPSESIVYRHLQRATVDEHQATWHIPAPALPSTRRVDRIGSSRGRWARGGHGAAPGGCRDVVSRRRSAVVPHAALYVYAARSLSLLVS